MSIKTGWEGRYFDDLQVGDVYRSSVGRTLLEADNTWMTLLTNNDNQIHFNTEYAKNTQFPAPADEQPRHTRRPSPASPCRT